MSPVVERAQDPPPHPVHIMISWDHSRCGIVIPAGTGRLYFGWKDFERFSMETMDFYINTLGHYKCEDCWEDIELYLLGSI